MQEPLCDELLECVFHKATLETCDEVVTGLTTVAQYLIDVCFTSVQLRMWGFL